MHTLPQRLVILFVLISGLYGVSYQQFRHFDPTDPRGANDALSYIKMSHGDYDVLSTHRYRFIIPSLAGGLQQVIGLAVPSPAERDHLSFYLVNLAFMAAAGWIFYHLLIAYGFTWPLALLGMLFFCCNRITALTTGTPIIDSAYYFAIVFTLFCVQRKRCMALALAMPLLALTKETTLPFLVLGWMCLRGKKAFSPLDLGLATAIACTVASRHIIGGLPAAEHASFVEVVRVHAAQLAVTLRHVFSPGGVHDMLNGYSLIAVLAVAGWWLHRKAGDAAKQQIPGVFLVVIPLVVFYALLSNNLGRMLFAACFVVIPYALVAIERVMDGSGFRNPEPGTRSS